MSLSKADPAVVLLDPMMVCSEPERLSGILFQRAELEQCLEAISDDLGYPDHTCSGQQCPAAV